MTNRLIRLPLLAAACMLAALILGACGGAKQPTAHGEGEGAYIQAGPLIYQVQMSRELNPADVEDAEYLEGLSADEPAPAGDEEWFGVWLRVQNDTDEAHTSASEFKIVDTTGTEYEPIALPANNPLAYQPTLIETDTFAPVQPDPESAAGTGVNNGEMLLFKLSTDVYANRPIELEIVPPDGGEPSSVVLDL
ncbi:MAG TPA: hypothetical protein VFS37_03370 [Conexibacter sp.]|nr:hypothetical protein [Conexibacter sp.]